MDFWASSTSQYSWPTTQPPWFLWFVPASCLSADAFSSLNQKTFPSWKTRQCLEMAKSFQLVLPDCRCCLWFYPSSHSTNVNGRSMKARLIGSLSEYRTSSLLLTRWWVFSWSFECMLLTWDAQPFCFNSNLAGCFRPCAWTIRNLSFCAFSELCCFDS